MLWHELSWRQHRKKYYINGVVQGTVMWVFNKPGRSRGHIYDLFCAFHSFQEISWEDIPRVFTGDFFNGKIVVYWRESIFQLKWHKDVIADPKMFRESFNTIFGNGDYRTYVEHSFNPICDYNLLSDDKPYSVQDLDFDIAAESYELKLRHMQHEVHVLTHANPEVARDIIEDVAFPLSEDIRENFLVKPKVKNHERGTIQSPAE